MYLPCGGIGRTKEMNENNTAQHFMRKFLIQFEIYALFICRCHVDV